MAEGSGSVCSRALGFVLLFLLPLALGKEVMNLKEIIKKLHNTYGIGSQYSLAINVPAKYCEKGAELNQDFLSQYSGGNVKNSINGPDRIYIGNQLIAAKPKPINGKNYNIHSEYMLLRYTTPSYMENLLNKDKQGCTVFFTMNSPCVQTCSTPNTTHSIIPGLDIFKNHRGPKAFVFRQVWSYDKTGDNNEQLKKNIKTIDKKIPVYKCSENQCVRCVKNNSVKKECTADSDQNRDTIMANEKNVYAFQFKRSISLENND